MSKRIVTDEEMIDRNRLSKAFSRIWDVIDDGNEDLGGMTSLDWLWVLTQIQGRLVAFVLQRERAEGRPPEDDETTFRSPD